MTRIYFCFLVLILFILINLVSSNTDLSTNDPVVKLSVSPTSGYSAENIEVRCEISPPLIVSSLSTSKFDNVYLSVKTDNVKPSGIILKFDDSTDRCQINKKENVLLDVCNATSIHIRITHSILNETLEKIDYSCSKGTAYSSSSYQLLSKPKWKQKFVHFVCSFF